MPYKGKGKEVERKGKGRKPYKGKSFEKDSKQVVPLDKDNDWKWYAKDEQIVSDAASLAFSNALGVDFDLTGDEQLSTLVGNTSMDSETIKVPGIMALNYIPAIGVTSGAGNEPVNVAAKNIYSWVRHANSGHTNYEAADLMIYLIAMGDMYSIHALGIRAYGLYNYYLNKNRYVPDDLLKACGFDPVDFRQHIADYRYFLNAQANKLNALGVPQGLSYFARRIWINSMVFKDDPDNQKAQLYVYRPAYSFTYNATYDTNGGGLTANAISYPFTFATYTTLSNTMLDALLQDEDINIMSGDIIKAYGESGLYKLGHVVDDFAITPEYSEEALVQIHNSTFLEGGTFVNKSIDIHQANNQLIFMPTRNATDAYSASLSNKILDIPYDKYEAKDIMVYTRNTFIAKGTWNSSISNVQLTPIMCGTEIVTDAYIFDKYTVQIALNYWRFNLNNSAITKQILSRQTIQYNKFDWAPLMYIAEGDHTGGVMYGVINDLRNFTLIKDFELNKMHTVALLSMFGVPNAGR